MVVRSCDQGSSAGVLLLIKLVCIASGDWAELPDDALSANEREGAQVRLALGHVRRAFVFRADRVDVRLRLFRCYTCPINQSSDSVLSFCRG